MCTTMNKLDSRLKGHLAMHPALDRRILENRWIFAFALSALALCVFEILDWYELPFETFRGTISTFPLFGSLIAVLLASGYIGLFIAMFLENMALPIPSELFLPLAGYFIFLGRMTFPIAIAISTAAGLLGSLAIYFVALKLGPPVVYSVARRLGISQGTLARSEVWLSGRYGSAIILAARFVPGLRSSISIPAGVLRMNPVRFATTTLIGSFGWSALLMYLGYSAGPLWVASENIITNAFIQALPYAVAIVSSGFIINYMVQKTLVLRADRTLSNL